MCDSYNTVGGWVKEIKNLRPNIVNTYQSVGKIFEVQDPVVAISMRISSERGSCMLAQPSSFQFNFIAVLQYQEAEEK